jgi:uncharacterized protein DUF1653
MTKPGIYEHHMGDSYRVLCTAMESTNKRKRMPVVVYMSLKTGVFNVRDEEEFNEQVLSPAADLSAPCWCDARGQPSCRLHPGDQKLVPRFKLVREL